MLVVTESPIEKQRNQNYPQNSQIPSKNNSTQVKVIANRITPYCKDILNIERDTIKTRKFLKDYKTKYKYIFSKKNTSNSEREKKAKLYSIEKKANLFQLKKLSKSKKKSQISVNRVNYNCIVNNSNTKNSDQEKDLHQLHLKDKKHKHSNKKSKKSLQSDIRDILLEHSNHIYGDDFPNLYTLNNNNLKSKVKANNDILHNKNITSRKSNASYKFIDSSSFNTPCINNNINDDDIFKSYINDSVSKGSLYSPHYKHKITTNSLIDSIVSLSNGLNTSIEKKNNEYDKNLLSYVNKILCDNNFYHGISSGVNKSELRQLESEIHKKCNDMISKFYFKTIFKNINCTQKQKNSIIKDSCNSYNSEHCDTQSSSKLVINENNNNVPKNLYPEKNRIKSPLSSNIHDIFYYSDNYFSEKPRKSEKKNNNNKIKQDNRACEASLKNDNLINGEKNNTTLAKNISKENISYKLTLDNDKHSVNYLKENNLHTKLKSFNQNFKAKKKRSIETQLTLGNTAASSVCNNVDIKPFKYDDNSNKGIVHDSYNSVNELDYNGIANTNNQISNVNKQLSTLNNFEKYDDSAFSRSNSLHYNKKCRTISTENNDQSTSKEDITIKNDHTEHRNILNEDISINKFDTTKKECSQGKKVSNLSSGKEDNNIDKSDDNKTDPKYKNLSIPQICMLNSCNISSYASGKCEASYTINSQNSSNVCISDKNIDSVNMTPKAENILKKKFNDTNIDKNSQYNNDNTCKENYHANEKKHINRYNTSINSSRRISAINNSINDTPLGIYNEYDSNINNIKRNDSYITMASDNLNDSVFNENQDSSYIPSSVYNNYCSSVANNRYSILSRYSNMQNKTSNDFSSPFINRSSNILCKPLVENCNNNLLSEENKKNNFINLFPYQKSIDIKPINSEDKKPQEEIKTNSPKEQIESNVTISNTVKKEIKFPISNFSEFKNLRSSINSISSSNLRKTPTISNIENDNYSIPPKYIPDYIKSFCIFKDNHKKDELSRITPLIDHVNSNNNDIGLITPKNNFDTSSLNKDIKMNNNDNEFSVDECLMKCLKEDPSKFRTNEDYERFCNEDKILNPSYIPHESRKLGENFIKNKKDNFSFINKNYNYEPNINIAECGNSAFNYDGGFNDSHKNYFNNIKINVFNNEYVNNDNNSYNNNSIYNNNNINNLSHTKSGNDHHTNDIFIKYYEKYSIKNLDKNESEKLNYTDCYDFKDSSLTEISKDDSFCSDDLGNDDNDMNFLKESLNSFDNLESTEKKYEQILKDFNGKIPLLHKVLKPLPVKNRSNNFDICLYLLQKHGGDLNNEENICILRDREIVQHSAIYDTKNDCIKSNITNVTNIKLYHPKWYNKKKIIERLKEQSCYNPFTIFGSAPSLLDFDEVFDKDVYNNFVSKNSRKNHSLLRILAKQKVISNLSDKISDKEWPQVHSYLKKRWSRETNIELNWACDPLLYEELEWYLSTNNEYLNMTDKVADIDVCYCPTLDPSSYYAWNDSRVIYTNLCYNKSKDDAEESNNDLKNKYSTNKSLEFKKNDKQLSFRKRASGCEHLMFQQNVMKQKKLSKKKKKLLKKKKKMIKEKYKTMDIDANFGNYGNGNNREDGKTIKSAEGFSYPYKNMCNYHENKTDYVNDQYMNDFKNNKENSSFYYSNSMVSKNKKSIYNHKNCEDNIVPIMAVNTSLYRNNMDNKYNCHNTAFDYIKNKDNTIKFFASPKKKKKKSVKKSINNSDCFDFINSSMSNSDNMQATNNNNENSNNNICNNNNDNGNSGFNGNDTTEFNEFNDFSIYNNNKNNFHIFEFNDSIKCNNMKGTCNKDMMLNEDNLKKKHNPKNYEQTGYVEEKCGNKNRQNDCELLDMNEKNFEKNNMHYLKSNTYMYDINNNSTSGMKNYIAKSNDNIVYKSNFNMKNQGDISQSFYKNKGINNNYGNDNNAKMTVFRNMQMGQKEYNMNNHKGNNNVSNDINSIDDNCSYRKGDNKMGFIPRNFDDKNDINTYYKVYNTSDNNNNSSHNLKKNNFHKNIYGNKNIYSKSDMRCVSDNYNNLKSNEISKNDNMSSNIGHFEYKSSKNNFPDHNILNQKDNINGLKEKYMNMCKEEKQLITPSSDHNHFNFFESNYENYNNNNDDNNERSIKITNEYFHGKNPENYIQMEKKKKKKKVSDDTGNSSNNSLENYQNSNRHINKNMRNNIPETNILKLTQENIDKKNIIENEIKNSNTLLYKKKNNNNAGISISSFNSKRLSNSNISVNENKKIRKYANKMHHDSDNISIEHSENDKQCNTNKEIAETPSSATSETSMSSAFKMATSVFKNLF